MRNIYLFFLLLLALANASIIQPLDLAEEAEEQLQELLSLVQGEILASHNDLEDLGTDFVEYGDIINYNGGLDVLQEYGTTNEQVEILKTLASGHDITQCLFVREEVFHRLPWEYRRQITECISVVNSEKNILLSDAKYYVDIVINKVYNLERQLQSCEGDLLCISPIVSQIALYKINLLQDIKVEVQTVDDQLTTLKISLKNCGDTNVAEYISRAYSLLRDITACVNRIIG